MLKADAQSTRSTLLGLEVAGSGVFWVRRGRGLVARLIAAVFRLPPDGDAIPVTLEVSAFGDAERWCRSFGGRPLVTTVRLDRRGMLVERLGPLELHHAMTRDGNGWRFSLVRARLAGVPVPRPLRPRILSIHREYGSRAHVYTLASFRGRLLLAYAGWIG